MAESVAWRCQHCRALIYNIFWFEDRAYPVAGAPSPKFASKWYSKVCTLCFQLYNIASESPYLKKLQLDWEKTNKIDDTPPSGWSYI